MNAGETQMIFKYSKNRVLTGYLFLWVLSGMNLIVLGMKIVSYFRFGRIFQPYEFVYFAYLPLTIWSIWLALTVCGRHIEVTDSEVKIVNRSGKVDKSARFDKIAALRLGSFIAEPRNHWIVGLEGKKWLLSGYCENHAALVKLVEERSGKSFVEPLSTKKKGK